MSSITNKENQQESLYNELYTIYDNKNKYKKMSQIVETFEQLGRKYSCTCIIDKGVSEKMNKLEKKIKDELLELDLKKGGRKTNHRRSKTRITQKKFKGGEINPDGYVVFYSLVLMMILGLIANYRHPPLTSTQIAFAESQYEMAQYQRRQDAAHQRALNRLERTNAQRAPESGEECPICMGLMNSRDYMITPCNHMFHLDCINIVKSRVHPGATPQCPLCRKNI